MPCARDRFELWVIEAGKLKVLYSFRVLFGLLADWTIFFNFGGVRESSFILLPLLCHHFEVLASPFLSEFDSSHWKTCDFFSVLFALLREEVLLSLLWHRAPPSMNFCCDSSLLRLCFAYAAWRSPCSHTVFSVRP